MAKPLLGTTWTVTDATGESPFGMNDTLKITVKSGSSVDVAHFNSVTSRTTTYTGTHESTRDRVKVERAMDEYWEFMLSSPFSSSSKTTLYGIRWKDSSPDAMGTWVCDPQT